MNSQQAKKIDFPDLLSRFGYQPVRITKGGRELWYRSPFRQESDPSFHTSYLNGKWIWNDFGDSGGNVIDFVMRHQRLQFREALAFLKQLYQSNLFQPSEKVHPTAPKSLNPITDRELEFLVEKPDKVNTLLRSKMNTYSGAK